MKIETLQNKQLELEKALGFELNRDTNVSALPVEKQLIVKEIIKTSNKIIKLMTK